MIEGRTLGDTAPLLVAEHLSFAYGRDPVLEDVSLTLRPHEFVALVGPNGSGKSTLVRILLGLLRPHTGSVRLFGATPTELGDPGRLGFVPQRPVLGPELAATVEEVAAMGCLPARRFGRLTRSEHEAVEHALESVGLLELRRRQIRDLSGGQQQRVFIARAFASTPDLLVLDEPIAGVDAESQHRFRDSLTHLVGEHGSSVLLVSHELGAVAESLDRVVVLKRRVVFDGTPQELVQSGVSLGVHREDLPLWLEALR